MREIFRLHDEGLLLPPADWYYRASKPIEELYDTANDPFELDDLAQRPEYQARLIRMRAAHEQWVTDTVDLGAIPEAQLADRYWPGGVQPLTPPPIIEPAGGTSTSPLRVAIRSETAGTSIAYTLETGDSPHWKLYTEPLLLDASATVRARAVRYGWSDSRETSIGFTITR